MNEESHSIDQWVDEQIEKKHNSPKRWSLGIEEIKKIFHAGETDCYEAIPDMLAAADCHRKMSLILTAHLAEQGEIVPYMLLKKDSLKEMETVYNAYLENDYLKVKGFFPAPFYKAFKMLIVEGLKKATQRKQINELPRSCKMQIDGAKYLGHYSAIPEMIKVGNDPLKMDEILKAYIFKVPLAVPEMLKSKTWQEMEDIRLKHINHDY